MRRHLSIALGALGLMGATASNASADTITYADQYVHAAASDGTGATSSISTSGASGSVAIVDAPAWATTSWNLTGTSATFGLNGATGGGLGSYAESLAYFTFTVDTNTTYSVSGIYTFSDQNGSIPPSERAVLGAYLYDTLGELLFYNTQYMDSAGESNFLSVDLLVLG